MWMERLGTLYGWDLVNIKDFFPDLQDEMCVRTGAGSLDIIMIMIMIMINLFMSTHCLPSTVLKHFTSTASLNSHKYSSIYSDLHFTDEETQPWTDYFIFLFFNRIQRTVYCTKLRPS